jgi:serine/threonine-protein kinase HipA
VPYGEELSLLVDDVDNSISVDLAIKTAPRFCITETEAKKLADDILAIVRENWENVAKKCGLSRSQVEDMRPAFGECYK